MSSDPATDHPDPASTPVAAPPARPRGHVLAVGFSVAVGMWVLAYLSMMNPGLVVGEILFAAMLGCVVAGGVVVGRAVPDRAAIDGALVGLVAGTVNLLLVGALIRRDTMGETIVAALVWGGGNYAASIILGAIGGLVGSRVPRAAPRRAWFDVFARAAATAAFLLLITGGLVTGLEAGLAVPDWPNSFGHNMLLYPVSEMTGGVYYEHAHRLYGMLVGLASIILVIGLFVYDRRRAVRIFGIVIFIMVCLQGLQGGLRVTGTLTLSDDRAEMAPNLLLAITHGVFGQIVFACFTAMAALVSRTWRDAPPPQPAATGRSDRRLSAILVGLLLAQLMLGATYRHLHGDESVPTGMMHGVLGLHVLLGVAIAIKVILVGGRAWVKHTGRPVLPRLGAGLMILVSLQILLGMGALVTVLMREPGEAIPLLEVVLTTAHQATGALLLAGATLLMLWTRRLLAAESPLTSGTTSGTYDADVRS